MDKRNLKEFFFSKYLFKQPINYFNVRYFSRNKLSFCDDDFVKFETRFIFAEYSEFFIYFVVFLYYLPYYLTCMQMKRWNKNQKGTNVWGTTVIALYVKLFIVLFAKQRKTSNHYITKMSFKCHVIIIYGKFEYKKMLSCKKSFIVCFLCFSSTKTNREDSTRFLHDRQRSVIVMLWQANIWAEIVIANLSRYTVCSPIA